MNKLKEIILLVMILAFTVFLYWHGLKGDYVFDDSVNILENEKLKISDLSFQTLKAAYGSGDAGPLGRPISMLSFALNYYFTGFNPFYFKLTNLCIHLINGVLIYFLSSYILNWINKDQKISKNLISILSLVVCTVWLIHPLNLTSVLYVVQRMTSLSTTFGLLALVLYCNLRTTVSSFIKKLVLISGIGFSFILSVLSKESGLLFILLLYWTELIIFQCKNNKDISLQLCGIKLKHIMWVGVLIGGGLLWYVVQPHFHPSAFLRRDFNLEERLLTESRVIFYYIKMFIYPQLNELSLYHDDFIISKSFLNPISTLYSVFGLIFITILSLFLQKKYPLVLFAWGWFLISHLMESTAFSLELVHEHRNYFAFIGFIIAIAYYVVIFASNKLKPFIYLLIIALIFNFALTTWQRSLIWSNLVDHALYEATMHPNSDRANYQLARIYIKLLQDEKDPKIRTKYIQEAEYYLAAAKASYLPANGAWFAEIHLYSYLNKQVPNETVSELVQQLKSRPFQNSNVSFLASLSKCQSESFCKLDYVSVINILTAGLENPTTSPEIKTEIYKILAQYYISNFNDFIKAEEFLKKAIELKNNVNGHLLLTQVYRLQGKLKLANEQLQIAQSLDHNGVWFKEINIEKRNIVEAVKLGK